MSPDGELLTDHERIGSHNIPSLNNFMSIIDKSPYRSHSRVKCWQRRLNGTTGWKVYILFYIACIFWYHNCLYLSGNKLTKTTVNFLFGSVDSISCIFLVNMRLNCC